MSDGKPYPSLPWAIILDIDFSGYGIVRSLTPYNIPVVAFASKKKFIPESKTRLCRVIRYNDEAELLTELMKFHSEVHKPVLYLTSDYYVSLVLNHRSQLEPFFRFNYPDNSIISMLLSKDDFTRFAIDNEVLIPKTYNIDTNEKFMHLVSELEYPVILKPYLRKTSWNSSGMPKAFYCANEDILRKSYNMAMKIDNELLIQEWIPGGDDHIYYCLTYFNNNSECEGAFSGQKMRQWPVDTGSTASTKPAYDNFLSSETIRIFSKVKYCGFGSIEYKKHATNNKFYLIEPTAGRLNQQEYVATLNGVNLPLIAYNDMSGSAIEAVCKKKGDVIYIDELAEFTSTITHFKRGSLTFGGWLKSLKGERRYRYFYYKDLFVFAGLLWKMLLLISRLFVNKQSE